MAAARRQAPAGARDIVCAQMGLGRLNFGHRIEIEDEQGEPVLALLFADAVAIER